MAKYFRGNFKMLIEDNLPLATNEELQELLVHIKVLYECHKQLREHYSKLHPMTKFIMDNFTIEAGTVTSHIGSLIETLGHGVSNYSRDMELIKEELERRK